MNLEKLNLALKIACTGFFNVYDMSGKPYILHCFEVMRYLDSDDEELNCIAILHDCVENNVCTLNELKDVYHFSTRVVTAVDLLTHDRSMAYDTYIMGMAHNEDCRRVKKSDLRHNSDITRLKGLSEKDFDRMKKYHKHYTFLNSFND